VDVGGDETVGLGGISVVGIELLVYLCLDTTCRPFVAGCSNPDHGRGVAMTRRLPLFSHLSTNSAKGWKDRHLRTEP